MTRALSLQQAGVTYRRYAHPRDALLEWLLRRSRHEVFHALQSVSFSLQPGDSLGVIGDNGAGKSTLLKLLAGTLSASSGRCEVQGKRSALLELGVGLQPECTGLENARLGMALRGLSGADIERFLPAVLDFAELGDFIHQPLKTYSSGMAVRLAFAVATAVAPDVLIVDEALSVGDQYFQKKSLDRMRAILHDGATLVFCSHNLYQVREMCGQAVWLEQGKVRMLCDSQAVTDAYQDAVRQRNAVRVPVTGGNPGKQENFSSAPQLLDVSLDQEVYGTHQPFAVYVRASPGGRALDDVHVGIVIRRNDDVQCFGISTLHDGVRMRIVSNGELSACFSIPQLPLLSGEYCLEVWLIDASGVHVYDSRERCCHFRVRQASQNQGIGVMWMPHAWGNEDAPAA